MGRPGHKTILINQDTGECVEYNSASDVARFLKVSCRAVEQAKERCGACRGWLIYPEPEELRKRINWLKMQVEFLEQQSK